MNELALFAGAGGGILGGKLLGWRTRCAVELNPYCRKVLLQRQSDGILDRFPIWDNVCTFDGKPWRGKIDVISGGFPCQDISAAGKGAGITGARSGLWKEMARVIGEVRPAYVLVENSPFLVSRGLDVVLADLAALGFDAEWGVIGACDAGAWQERKRLWLVANTDNIWKLQQKGREQNERGRTDYGTEKENATYFDLSGLEISKRRQRSTPKKWAIPAAFDWREPELAGKNIFKSRVCGMVHGFSSGVDRVKALGNAQVPAVVKLAWDVLMETTPAA